MEFSRRAFLLLGVSGAAVYLAGCTSAQESGLGGERPSPLWPGGMAGAGGVMLPNPAPGMPWSPPVPPVAPPSGTGPLRAIARSAWTNRPPMYARILPMNGVERITVHHEGSGAVEFSDAASTAQRLEMVREYHAVERGWGDIGYHYVIDRAGRVWQGRDVAYQGAHVRDHNAHNLGVMVLGNFDLQRPTDVQVSTLRASLVTLQRSYRIPTQHVYTHQELNPTECPGVALQRDMVVLRRGGLA
jgi:hypothetical protein